MSELDADSMWVGRKPYAGPARVVDLSDYRLHPADLQAAMAPFAPVAPTRRQRWARSLARWLLTW